MNPIIRLLDDFERHLLRSEFTDREGRKGIFGLVSRARKHRVSRVIVGIPGWPVLARPLRALFLADLHLGSHTNDVARLHQMLADGADCKPDVGLLGGDYVNGMLFGKGRIPPDVTFSLVSRFAPPLGWFAILGDHDDMYGTTRIVRALEGTGIRLLNGGRATLPFQAHELDIVGIKPLSPDPAGALAPHLRGRPAIVLAHDPAAFYHLPKGPYLMLSGHTHGGQIWLPGFGPFVNMSTAPLRWTYGHTIETDRQLYVTSGVGTSGLPIRVGIPPEIAIIDINGVPAG